MSLWERIKFVVNPSSVVRSYTTISDAEFARMWNENLEKMKIPHMSIDWGYTKENPAPLPIK